MIDRIRSRFSSAHLIAGTALLFAVGGGSALALQGVNSVNSGDIRNGSVRSADVRNNGLRGVDIREGTLNCGAIPNADCSADDATEGGGAPGTPGGGSTTTAFSFRTSTDQTVNNLVNAGGLTIDVNCTGADLDVVAETSVDNSTIYTASLQTAGTTVANQDNDADFDTPDPRDLVHDGQEGLQVGHTSYAAGTSGPVVDVQWSSDEDTPNLDCVFVGQVTFVP
jgi:hypothetical protein